MRAGEGVFLAGGRLLLLGLCLAICLYALIPIDQPAPELPPCYLLHPTLDETLLGLPWPPRDPAFQHQAIGLALFYAQTRICRMDWHGQLPQFSPWDGQLGLEVYAGSIFATAGLCCLLLLPLLPRAWWRRLTLLGIIGWCGLSWGLGVAGLATAQKLGLPQHYLLDEIVWLNGEPLPAVQDIATLDQHLLAAGVPLRDPAPAVALRPVRDSLEVFRDTVGGLSLADLMRTDFTPTGAQTLRDGERFLELRVGEGDTRVWLPARVLAVGDE